MFYNINKKLRRTKHTHHQKWFWI